MTDLLREVDTPSDAELISRIRGGDVAAYGELFTRHVAAAKRLARQLAKGHDVDDLVSEAFAKVLQVLQGGGGPDVAFRAYLLTSVRRLHVDRVRASSKLQTSDDMTQFDPGIPFQDTAVAAFENSAAARAFASLPERWQLVLWHLEVEEQKPAEIAPLLGMSANSVSALAYRAREGLRQAFLTQHLNEISDTDCRWVNEHLGGYVRKGLSRRDTAKVDEHLDECPRCTAMYLELTEVNDNLAAVIGPLLLGGLAAGYLASSGAAGTGVFALLGNAKEWVAGNASTAMTAGAVAAGVAAVATAGFLFATTDDPPERVITADERVEATTTPGEAGTSAPVPVPSTPAPSAPTSPATSPATQSPSSVSDTSTTNVLGAAPAAFVPADGTPAGTVPGGGTNLGGGDGQDGPGGGDTDPAAGGGDTNPPGKSDPPGGGHNPPPGDEDPPGEDPGPGEDDPPTLNVTLKDGDVSVDAGNLVVSVDGLPLDDPDLTLEIDLKLGSGGTGFVAGSTDDCGTVTHTHAECLLGTPATFGGSATFRLASAIHQVVIPLKFPEGMSSDTLDVTVGVEGYVDEHPGDNTVSLNFNDFAMSVLKATYDDDTNNGQDTYHLRSHITGVPAEVDELFFDLTDLTTATFGAPVIQSGDVTCELTNGRIRCENLAPEFTIDFTVHLPESTTETVTINLNIPDGYTDNNPGDTTRPSLLARPQADLVLGELTLDQRRGAHHEVLGTVSGVPVEAEAIYFKLTAAKARFTEADGEGDVRCDSVSDNLIECYNLTASFEVRFFLNLPPGHYPETVVIEAVLPDYTEADDGDNGATLPIDHEEK